VRGELYWGVNALDTNATNAWSDQWNAGGNGDGSLTYTGLPSIIGGKSVIPIASQRLKHARDGLEDLEYMYLAEAKVGRPAVLEVVRGVVQSTHAWSHDPDVYFVARTAIAKLAGG
jgi:hypothetical protein